MRGKIETTIPQRQYENIKTTYEFETMAEKAIAVENAIQDCIKLSDIVPKLLQENANRINVSGVNWRKVDGKWVYDAEPA